MSALNVELEYLLKLLKQLVLLLKIKIFEFPILLYITTGSFKPTRKVFFTFLKNTIKLYLMIKLYQYACRIVPELKQVQEFITKYIYN